MAILGPQVDRIAGLPAHTRSPALNVFLAEVPGHGTGNDVRVFVRLAFFGSYSLFTGGDGVVGWEIGST